MKSWLKYYFLAFFSDKYAKEGAGRSFWNTALSLVLMFLLLATGYFTGYMGSFAKHYSDADAFRGFLYSAFASSGEQRINLKTEGGKLSAELPEGDYINDFLDEDVSYNAGGYRLIVDTRPAATTYDDFKVICRGGESEISYEEYTALSEEGKKGYSLQLEYSGRTLDLKQKQEEYLSYLNGKQDYADELNKLKDDLAAQTITDAQFDEEVYILYIKAYYPAMDSVERYGRAPTLRTYYQGMITSDFSDKFLMLLDDMCIGSFETEKNIAVDFEGYFSSVKDAVITADGMGEEEMRANLDGFISEAFKKSGGINYLMYIINMFKLISVLLVAYLAVAFIFLIAKRFLAPAIVNGYIQSLKVTGAFVFIDAVISFLFAIVLSFVMGRNAAYIVTAVLFVAVLLIRDMVLLITEHARLKKEERQTEN